MLDCFSKLILVFQKLLAKHGLSVRIPKALEGGASAQANPALLREYMEAALQADAGVTGKVFTCHFPPSLVGLGQVLSFPWLFPAISVFAAAG